MTEPEAAKSLSVTRDTIASRQRVWEVLADGWTYSQWVVGTSRMRAVDPRWPEPGSVIHHTLGVWPALLNDSTEVLASIPARELVLLARARPLGKARITMRLFDIEGGGCRIEMAEVPVNPPLSWLPDRVMLAAVFPRNRECTWRLAALAERREADD